MACRQWMQADAIRFRVTGRGAQGLLARAAGQGIRLRGVRCAGAGYAATVSGRDWPRLQALAAAGGWQLSLVGRRGPGRRLEGLVRRPGVLAGAVVFLVLCVWLPAFVWQIDFGTLPASELPAVRSLLAEQGIWEGCRLREGQLRQAQAAMERRMPDFGWIGLHFAGGCLSIEYTERETQSIRPEPQPAALYAKAAGQITAMELTGGFPAVVAGQYVAEGQLLANGQKSDRNEEAVSQAASGRVLAAVQRRYQADQPLQQTAAALTGRAQTRRTLYLFGTACTEPDVENPTSLQGQRRESWQPLALGRVTLPACLHTETLWEETEQTFSLSAQAARDLARRTCRLQLLAEFPDAADVEESLAFSEKADGTVRCIAEYRFTANIAQAGPVAPLEKQDAG